MANRVSEGPKRALVTGAGARQRKDLAKDHRADGREVTLKYTR